MGNFRPSKADLWSEAQANVLELVASRFVKPGERPDQNIFVKLVGHITGRKLFTPTTPQFIKRARAKGLDLFIDQPGGAMNNKSKNTASVMNDPVAQKLLKEASEDGVTSNRETATNSEDPPQRLEPITPDDLVNTDFLTFLGKKIREG